MKKNSFISTMRVVAVALGLSMTMTGNVIANGVVHSVHVGGPDTCSTTGGKPGCDANFSLTANLFSDGRVNGRWMDVIATGPGGANIQILVDIECLHVVGNEAWVSGAIVGGPFAGFRAGARVMDNGVSRNDPADAISFTQAFYGHCSEMPDFPLFGMVEGQVTVR